MPLPPDLVLRLRSLIMEMELAIRYEPSVMALTKRRVEGWIQGLESLYVDVLKASQPPTEGR